MDRREVLTLFGTTATAIGGVGLVDAASAAENDHDQSAKIGFARHHTGRVGLIFSGEKTAIRTGPEILEAAKEVRFHEPGLFRVDTGGGSIEYVPAEFTPNAVAETIVNGRILYRMKIAGDPPSHYRSFEPGTYLFHLDFVEGPEMHDGRWVGRIVDEAGQVRKIVHGVEVKEIVEFHVSDADRDAHSKPSINTHSLALPTDQKLLFDEKFVTDGTGWDYVSGEWEKVGSCCCKRTQYCIPK